MKNILLSVITLCHCVLGFGQNGFMHGFPISEMKLAFPMMIIPDDPIKAAQVIQDFNQSSKQVGWRTSKLIQLDSIVSRVPAGLGGEFQRNLVSMYEYTEADLASTASYFLIDPAGDTTARIREELNYNSQYQIEKNDVLIWDNTAQAWTQYARQTFEYNDDDLLFELIEYHYDGDSLQPTNKYKYTYNGVQLPEKILEYIWDEVLLVWEEKYQTELTYNAFKKLSLETFATKSDSTSSWVYWSKTEYGYNQSLLLTETLFYWNFNVWDPAYRSFYTYDGQKLILQADKVWEDPPQIWVDNWESRYEYDVDGRKISGKNRRWFPDGNEWIIGDSSAIVYNEFSDTASVILYSWNSSSQKWDERGFSKFTYDTQIDFSSIRWPISFIQPIDSTYNKQVTEVLNANRFYGNIESSVYYYSLIVASTEIPNESWSVFPNPATDEIHLQLPEFEASQAVEFYNANGMLVKTVSVKNNSSIPIQDLPSGIYLFRIKRGNSFLTGKFIKL